MKTYLLPLLAWPMLIGSTDDPISFGHDKDLLGQNTIEDSCTFNGIPLHGKVQFVDAFPDIKIQYVNAFPDINVKWVEHFPDDCGEWQEVDAFPDFKVQVVEAFPDVKVKIVEAFPGVD